MGAARPESARLDADGAASGRHVRADAQRNRERLLEAADELLATRGVDVSVDDIAHRAQLGVGTLYRNFPTKEALLEALLLARIEPLVVAARDAAAGIDDPGDAFVGFVRHLSNEFANFKALADAMVASGIDIHATKRALSAELFAAIEELFDKAQRAGRIRPDVTLADVSAMMTGLGHADPAFMDPSQRSRCVALVCDSLLVGARSVLPRQLPVTGATSSQT
jgi:AcrR family transcriptional regulator